MIAAGADGFVPAGKIADTGCCPPSLCDIDPCGLVCAFISLLPSGPLWDEPKTNALQRFQSGCHDYGCLPDENDCQSLVAHSVYIGLRFYDLINDALWPSLREADPCTAYDTLDEWIDRLGWEDCFYGPCRDASLGELTPYEIEGPCGPLFCEPDIPDELAMAVKRGVVMALTRLNMGITRNLASINWVINPLGAQLSVADGAPDDGCDEQRFEISSINDEIDRAVKLSCPPTAEQQIMADTPVQAFYGSNCTTAGLPSKIYPGVLAAECIVRSIMPPNANYSITRNC